MPLQGNLSIERMCELARVSRASFYRSFHQQQPVAVRLPLTALEQAIAERKPGPGLVHHSDRWRGWPRIPR